MTVGATSGVASDGLVGGESGGEGSVFESSDPAARAALAELAFDHLPLEHRIFVAGIAEQLLVLGEIVFERVDLIFLLPHFALHDVALDARLAAGEERTSANQRATRIDGRACDKWMVRRREFHARRPPETRRDGTAHRFRGGMNRKSAGERQAEGVLAVVAQQLRRSSRETASKLAR